MEESNQLANDVLYYLTSDKSHKWKELINLITIGNSFNPYKTNPDKYMWIEQSAINIPLLYISSIYLYKYAKKHNIDTYLFATRDCCLWVKIFSAMYPDENAVYFDCSRNMLDGAYENNNKYYNDYVKNCFKTTSNNAVFIDIHGTGKRMFSYFEKQYGEDNVPFNFLLSSSCRKYHDFPSISIKYHKLGKLINLVFDARGSPIEMLNYDIQGTCQTYDRHGAKRDDPEYDLRYLEAYHICVKYVCTHIKPNETNDTNYELNKLHSIIKKIYRVIQDNKPAVSVYIKHPSKHPKLKQ